MNFHTDKMKYKNTDNCKLIRMNSGEVHKMYKSAFCKLFFQSISLCLVPVISNILFEIVQFFYTCLFILLCSSRTVKNLCTALCINILFVLICFHETKKLNRSFLQGLWIVLVKRFLLIFNVVNGQEKYLYNF